MAEEKFIRVAMIAVVSTIIALAFNYFFIGNDETNLPNADRKDLAKNVTKDTNVSSKKEELSVCLSKADENYENRWAGACAARRSGITREYNECMTLQKSLPKGYCSAKWDIPPHDQNCALSSGTARYLDEQLQKNKEFCYRIFYSSGK